MVEVLCSWFEVSLKLIGEDDATKRKKLSRCVRVFEGWIIDVLCMNEKIQKMEIWPPHKTGLAYKILIIYRTYCCKELCMFIYWSLLQIPRKDKRGSKTFIDALWLNNVTAQWEWPRKILRLVLHSQNKVTFTWCFGINNHPFYCIFRTTLKVRLFYMN